MLYCLHVQYNIPDSFDEQYALLTYYIQYIIFRKIDLIYANITVEFVFTIDSDFSKYRDYSVFYGNKTHVFGCPTVENFAGKVDLLKLNDSTGEGKLTGCTVGKELKSIT